MSTLPSALKPNETFMLRDRSWAVLFPKVWLSYRKDSSLENAAKIKVLAVQDSTYLITLMEVAPVAGRMLLPTNLTATVTLETIHRAMQQHSYEPPTERIKEQRKAVVGQDKRSSGELKLEPVQKVMRACWYCRKQAMMPKYKRFCGADCRTQYHAKVGESIDFRVTIPHTD